MRIIKNFKDLITFILFSAAKAPYLARFKVRKVGIKELEDLAMSVSDEDVQDGSSDTSPNENDPFKPSPTDVWQAAIFKVNF